MRNPPPGYQTVSPYLLYEDAPRAIEHLKSAFGFEERLSQTGGGGRTHTELVLGDDGLVMIGQAGEGFSSPKSLGNTRLRWSMSTSTMWTPCTSGPRRLELM
jgi:uncharacterized glyoxalase superfamily protein PhnB